MGITSSSELQRGPRRPERGGSEDEESCAARQRLRLAEPSASPEALRNPYSAGSSTMETGRIRLHVTESDASELRRAHGAPKNRTNAASFALAGCGPRSDAAEDSWAAPSASLSTSQSSALQRHSSSSAAWSCRTPPWSLRARWRRASPGPAGPQLDQLRWRSPSRSSRSTVQCRWDRRRRVAADRRCAPGGGTWMERAQDRDVRNCHSRPAACEISPGTAVREELNPQ